MRECTCCGGYKPDRAFYTIGPARRMSECADCNHARKADAYQRKPRLNLNLGRDRSGKFARAA